MTSALRRHATTNRALDGVLLIGAATAWYFGLVDIIREHDPYFLCVVIAIVGLFFYTMGHWTTTHARLGTETVITLGLFGTITGFMIMIVDGATTGDLYAKLPGASTAFMTTAVGLFCGIALRYQAWMQGDRW